MSHEKVLIYEFAEVYIGVGKCFNERQLEILINFINRNKNSKGERN
jgi:hypothetical protein